MVSERITAWRQAHPRATLTEIEAAVDAQLSAIRAGLISDAAQAQESSGRPVCPACGVAMHRGERRPIRLATDHGGEIDLTAQHWVCPSCGTGFSPPA